MDPNDIWAIPPLATTGDDDIDVLFASVGRALTNWELLEANLSLLFAYVVEPKGGSEEARRAYGSVVTFRGRADMLMAAAEIHFAHTGHAAYGDLKKLVSLLTTRAAARRNEIAHGVVQQLNETTGRSWALLPAWYSTSKRRPPNNPTYTYTSTMIDRFGKQFKDVIEQVWPILDAVQS